VEFANPSPDWISSRIWFDILSLTGLETFLPVVETFAEFVDGYKVFVVSF